MTKTRITLLSCALAAFATAATAACSSKGTTTASDSDSVAQSAMPETPVADADSVYAYVEAQTSLGPRVPGSAAHARCVEMLKARLVAAGAEVSVDAGVGSLADGSSIRFENIFGRFGGDKERRVLLLAHYDTRPWADEDPDPANHDTPIDGANDGASGVAVLLEVARHIAAKAPGIGVDILFTDAEDSGMSAPEGSDDATVVRYENSWCIGTQHWVRNMPYDIAKGEMPAYAILVDMVGAGGAVFAKEYFSMRSAPQVVSKVWDAAARRGYGEMFVQRRGGAINDDHIHIIGAGIPAIDIIDAGRPGGFTPTWHTLADNIANIDRTTLQAVAQVLLDVIYSEQPSAKPQP